MDENGAQESGMDFYAQFKSLKALEKKFFKFNHQFSLAVQSPAGQASLIAKLSWIGWQDSVRVRPKKTSGYISKIFFENFFEWFFYLNVQDFVVDDLNFWVCEESSFSGHPTVRPKKTSGYISKISLSML